MQHMTRKPFQTSSLSPDPIDRQTVVAALDRALARDPDSRLLLLVAFQGLGRTDLAAPPALLAALDDPSVSIRGKALRAISQFGSGVDSAVPVLLADVATQPDGSARRAAGRTDQSGPYHAAAEGMRPSAGVIPLLTRSLKSDNRNVRGTAALMLGRIGIAARPAAPALVAATRTLIAAPDVSYGPGDPLIFDFAPALAEVAPVDQAVSFLCEALRPNCYWTRTAAASSLGRIGPRAHAAIPALLSTLREGKPVDSQLPGSGYAIAIVEAIGRIVPEAQVPSTMSENVIAALCECLDSRDRNLRSTAAESLGKFGPRAMLAIPRLQAIVDDESAPRRVRDTALEAVARIQAPLR
jgi:HEAT repeat protein